MKILIAEDEHDIAMQYKISLENRKHQVVLTNDGDECVKAYHDALKEVKSATDGKFPFDLVVLDHRMPKKDGVNVAKEILKINPDQRILFASAYSRETLVNDLKELNRAMVVIQKPFRISALVNTVEDEEIPAQLEKINVKVRALRDMQPADDELSVMVKTLSKIHRPDVWYAIGDTAVE
jgi:DNA-binding response OmpR family regulator